MSNSPRTDALWGSMKVGLVPMGSPLVAMLIHARLMETERNQLERNALSGAAYGGTTARKLIDAEADLTLSQAREGAAIELLRECRKVIDYLMDEANLSYGIETLHRIDAALKEKA